MNNVRIPITVAMNIAKTEIERLVMTIMETNGITPELMVYIVESVQSNLKTMESMKTSDYINDLHKKRLDETRDESC